MIAPNAFKGSLSVLEAAQAFAKGARAACPACELDLMPIADGGDGVMDCLLAARGGRKVFCSVRGPLGREVRASWALLSDGSACVEMARASGLALVPPARRRAMLASTYGSGQLIAAALERGAKTVVFGLGGTASSDGGAGLAQALGARLLDARGRDIGPGAQGLLALDRIDASALRKRLRGIAVIGVTDVTNPLLGGRGSAAVYAPQKGATPAEVDEIERALARLSRVVGRDLGVSPARRPGAGAAGGCGFGLLAFLGAQLEPGAQFVLDACDARARLAKTDAALTGEGKLDRTSFFGKAPIELARLAKSKGVPCALVCGDIDASARPSLAREGVTAAVSLLEAGAARDDAMRRAARWAATAAELAVKGLAAAGALASILAFCPASARAHDGDLEAFRQADAAYFKRDQPGELEKSLRIADQEIARLHDGAPAADFYLLRCRALVRRGEGQADKDARLADFEAAMSDCQKAVTLSSGTVADMHFWHAVAMGRYGETKGVFKSLFLVGPIRREAHAALALDPEHSGAEHVLAEVDWHVPGFAGGDKKRALSEFEKAYRLSPAHSANYVPLARAYHAFGRDEDAKIVLDKLAALTRDDCDDPPQLAADQKEGAALRAQLK